MHLHLKGFGNLKTAADPISEASEREILSTLVQELNSHFPLNLSEDFICDRYLEDEVFQSDQLAQREIILIGSSYLSRVAAHLEADWEVVHLTKPGWRITDDSVSALATELQAIMRGVNSETAAAIFQIFENSAYRGTDPNGGPLPSMKGGDGRYHVEGCLRVIDKNAVKALTAKLGSVFRALGSI